MYLAKVLNFMHEVAQFHNSCVDGEEMRMPILAGKQVHHAPHSSILLGSDIHDPSQPRLLSSLLLSLPY